MIGDILRIRYELTQAISEGPVFAAFVARDRVMNREVCVRVLKRPYSEEPTLVTKLAEIVGEWNAFTNPGLQKLTAVDADGDKPFLVSELPLGSVQLCEKIRKLAPYSVPVAVAMAISICESLASIHNSGLVHGDVGPHNINLNQDRDAQLELAGVWKAYSSSQTAGAAVLSNMAPYLAPEISGGGMPSARSDTYSAGVILFELLTGRLPYYSDSPVGMALKHATEATPAARSLNASIPLVLEEIVKKAMSKDPSGRYPDAGEMLSDLRMLQDALRFGRNLNWPISPTGVQTQVPPVAPKMSAMRSEKGRADEKEEYDADVPVWVKTSIAFLMGLLAVMVVGWVIFNVNKPKQILVPDVKELTITEASDQLKKFGLKLHVVQRKPSEQLAADRILDASPASGERVYEGSQIDVVVSSGSQNVEVPDLRGLTLDKAKSLLGSVNLKIDDTVDMIRSKSVDEGLVVSQIPEARKQVERETLIRVKVSNGNKRVEGSGDLGAKNFYTVHVKLVDLKEPVVLRVDMTDDQGTKTVHEDSEEYPESDIEVTAEGYGQKVTFRIFYDGELVKQVVKEPDQPDGGQ